MTRNFRLSYPNRPSHTKKRKNKLVTRNFWPSFQKSDQLCHLFLVTFYNYPARSIVDKEQERKNKKVTRTFQLSSYPSHVKKEKKTKKWREIYSCLIRVDPLTPTKKRNKNKKVTRNFQLTYPKRPSHAKKEKTK